MSSTPDHTTPDGFRVPRSAEKKVDRLKRELKEEEEKEKKMEERNAKLEKEREETLTKYRYKELEDGRQEMFWGGVWYVAPKEWNYWHSWKPWKRGGKVPNWARESERKRLGLDMDGGEGEEEKDEDDGEVEVEVIEGIGFTPEREVEVKVEEGKEEVPDFQEMMRMESLDEIISMGETEEKLEKKMERRMEEMVVKLEKKMERRIAPALESILIRVTTLEERLQEMTVGKAVWKKPRGRPRKVTDAQVDDKLNDLTEQVGTLIVQIETLRRRMVEENIWEKWDVSCEEIEDNDA